MRLGAVDIGTNSCRLLIAEPDDKNSLIRIYQEMETTRIGEGLISSGILGKAPMDRTLLCLERFKSIINEYGVEKWRVVATSAVREAGNGAEFSHKVRIQVGMEVVIVDGEEEARLSYEGVQRGLNLERPPLVVDLGGGSTEFICPDEKVMLSLPLGAVRATEADMSSVAMKETLRPILNLKERLDDHPLVMTGGTASTLVAVKEGMEEFDSQRVHGQKLSRMEIGDLYNLLERMPLSLRRRLPGLQPERADIIPKGALIALLIMQVLGKAEIIVSESDILEGIIWSLMD